METQNGQLVRDEYIKLAQPFQRNRINAYRNLMFFPSDNLSFYSQLSCCCVNFSSNEKYSHTKIYDNLYAEFEIIQHFCVTYRRFTNLIDRKLLGWAALYSVQFLVIFSFTMP